MFGVHQKKEGFYIETLHKEYVGYDDPVFFDKSEYAWVKKLEQNYGVIRDELESFLAKEASRLKEYPEKHLLSHPGCWKTLPFLFNGIRFSKNRKQFPQLNSILDDIPGIISAAISVLEPSAQLHPHNGSTNAVMRGHLPLIVPSALPQCGMRIAGQDISWHEGSIFMFCDMKMHEVWNLTNQRRYVLMFDVMRDEFLDLKRLVCVHTIARTLTNIVINFVKGVLRA